MRKYLLLLIVLCLHLGARGQTCYEYDYWFDNDRKTLKSGSSSDGAWQLQVDVNDLRETLHAIHLQVRDSEGNMSSPVTRYFVKTSESVTANGRYWFDDNDTQVFTSSQVQGIFDIDVSHLSEGFHTIHYQVLGTKNNVSSTASRSFYKSYMPSNSSWHCWFDNDETTMMSGTETNQALLLDVSKLTDGFHLLHIQVEGVAQSASTPITKYFVKIPQTIGVDSYTCLCMVDDKLFKQEKVASTGGVVEWNLDVSQLPQGFHRIFVQVVTPSGAASNTWQSFFLRETTRSELDELKCVYAIDGTEFYTEAGTMADGTFHFDLDVSSLDDGLHRIAYMLSNGKGITTKVQGQFFIKTPMGGNGITEYWYWLNEQGDQNATKVTLPERQNPFSLITLLPVTQEPIRSSAFQFRIENGKPIIYSKNDIHVRFFDVSGRFTTVSKQYVDEREKQEVEPVGELQATQTFPKVTENDIQWYTMQVAPGDTAAFRLSQAATLQAFAPSGKEVFKTSESASVQWGGIHTWEDGTYYVAVHDVTGSQSDMALDYMHMDKYDVVDWDVHTVGNGGCSTITFKGNGFRDLYRVDLYTAAGDSIHSVDISHDSDAETSVTFDFSGAELCVYNAVFHFTQEDKHFANIVTVEEAVDIELATNVTFPSTFLRGTSTTYTIKITNKGNMTAYQVPIYTYIKCPSKNGISFIKYEGLNLTRMIDDINIEDMPDENMQLLKEHLISLGDDMYFLRTWMQDDDTKDSVLIRTNYAFITIPPKKTETLKLSIESTEKIETWVTVPTDWIVYAPSPKSSSKKSLRRSKIAEDYYCCYKEHIECIGESFVNACDIVSPIMAIIAAGSAVTGHEEIALFMTLASIETALTGCAASLGTDALKAFGDALCNSDKGRLMERLRDAIKTKVNISISTYLSCVGGVLSMAGLSQKASLFLNCMISSGSLLNDFVNLYDPNSSCNSITKPKPNCPPNPGGGGGTSTPQPPSDPNDIYGYLSDAGSKFMTDEVEKVNYTIEFENDTAFAQASAHTIVIRDTLDSRYFDLKSFVPTSVKIGEHETFLDEDTDVKTTDGVTRFQKTIDMRPEINAIAQVVGEYIQQTGIAKWTFTSLDPMTMEPTDDLMQGILPVNYNGTSGIGEVMFEVGVKPNKGHGAEIKNRAGIVFDYEESILTPTWTNIVDAIASQSHVTDVQMLNDSTATVSIAATDELSGPWRYDVYVQYGEGSAWWKAAENIPVDTTASVRIYEGINHGFYVVVTDSAGNVEKKVAEREFTLDVFGSLEETNTSIELAQGWNWISHNQQSTLSAEALKPASTQIVGQTEELTKDPQSGWMGNLDGLLPTQMYKIQVNNPQTIQLSGSLFNSVYRNIPLYQGWNWIGYPMANTMTPAEALAKLEAEEGDMLIGQDGLTAYSDGQWIGTLMEMVPGLGYMYRSTSDKKLFYNVAAQASARRGKYQTSMLKSQIPEGWTVDKRKYPNVMGVIAVLMQNNDAVDVNEWIVGAFSNGECRGISSDINGALMMNVYGQGGEPIVFYAVNCETGEIQPIAETELFEANVLGFIQLPYSLHIGETTGISGNMRELMNATESLYDLHGRKVEGTQLKKGIYVTTDKNHSKTQKVVRR